MISLIFPARLDLEDHRKITRNTFRSTPFPNYSQGSLEKVDGHLGVPENEGSFLAVLITRATVYYMTV